jgi:TonB family protein
MHEPEGLQRMALASALLHMALFAGLFFAPGRWLGQPPEVPHTVMTISLGGTAGPENGGMTSIGGRPVQEVTPPEAPREAVRPPAAKAPEMTVPDRNAKALKSASSSVKQAPDEARGKAATRGVETSAGSSVAATGARGQGFGLSSGGGTGIGGTLDVTDFCCPDYLVLMVQKIQSNWNTRVENAGNVVARFTIDRTGAITDPRVEQTSGVFALDQNALRALVATRQLPALPDPFPNPTLTVHLTFQYTK